MFEFSDFVDSFIFLHTLFIVIVSCYKVIINLQYCSGYIKLEERVPYRKTIHLLWTGERGDGSLFSRLFVRCEMTKGRLLSANQELYSHSAE